MKTIACYGDSLVYGFPYGPEYSWLRTVEKIAGLHLINFGCCGETCTDISWRLRFGQLPAGTDGLLFFGGANDVLQGTPPAVSRAALGQVLDFAGEKNLPLCVVLPLLSGEPSCNGRLAELRREFAALCEGRAEQLDLQIAVGLDDDARERAYSDGFHPRAGIYEKMGEYAAPLLAEWLK